MIIFLSLIFSLSNAFGQSVYYLSGTASQEENGTVNKLKKGDPIKVGSLLKVSKDSLLIISFESGSKLKLEENSEIKIKKTIEEAGEKLSRIKYVRGVLIMEFVRSSEKETLLIKKNEFAVGVRGTKFLIGEDGEDIYTSVEEGQVSVIQTKDQDEELVSAGESLVFEKGKRLTKADKFEWSRGLNWSLKRKALQSGFRNESFRKKRREEIKKKIKSLRKRKKRPLTPVMKGRVKRFNLLRFKAKKIKKNKVQEFRKRLKNRKLIRRRRP